MQNICDNERIKILLLKFFREEPTDFFEFNE